MTSHSKGEVGDLRFVTNCDRGEGVNFTPKVRDVIYGRPPCDYY